MRKNNSVPQNLMNLLLGMSSKRKTIPLAQLLDITYGPAGSKTRKQFEARLKKLAKGSELEVAALAIAARNANDNKKAKSKKVDVREKRYKAKVTVPRAKARKEKEHLAQHLNDAGL